MKTLRITSLLLFGFALTGYALPAPAPLAILQQPASTNKLGQEVLWRYRRLRDTELPQMLAWLREWGPFTQPMPGQLPAGFAPVALASQ